MIPKWKASEVNHYISTLTQVKFLKHGSLKTECSSFKGYNSDTRISNNPLTDLIRQRKSVHHAQVGKWNTIKDKVSLGKKKPIITCLFIVFIFEANL